MRLRDIFLQSSMRMTRLVLAFSSLTWAILLLLPGPTFYREVYEIMAVIAPENVWGMLFAIHGIIAIYTIKQGTRNKTTLACDGFLGCILWTASTLACFVSYWPAGDFLTALKNYHPPVAMSGNIWLAAAAWLQLIKHWAEDEREHYERTSR